MAKQWVLRLRVHERMAEPDMAITVKGQAETLARFAGVDPFTFVQAGTTVFLKPVRGDALQVMKIGTFAYEQFGWVLFDSEEVVEP